MAKKTKEAEEAQDSGTARVLESGTVRIPGPAIVPAVVGKDKEAPKAKAEKVVTDRSAQNALVPGIHLNLEQNRDARLRDLGRTNLDVKWANGEIARLRALLKKAE